ncbi:MAG: SufS family cysteine desulfurase [Alphaproteobacteria bacterium]
MTFDVEKTRKDFPILSREIQGNILTYLDNAASSQKPMEVLEGIKQFESNDYSNVHRGLHTLSVLSTSAYEESRKIVQKFLNAKSSDEIIFTSGGTDSVNLVASSYADENLSQGDEIIITTMEHHANIVPWHFLRERKGIQIKWIDCDQNGNFNINQFEKAITSKTKFIAVTQMSNVLGASPNIKNIIDLAHSQGIPVLIDGCQGVVHEKIDVQELDCDFYLFSGHKLYGPNGIGILYAKSQYLERMRPWRGGGDMIKYVQKENITYSEAPNKFEAGTPNITGAVGLGMAINYFEKKIKEGLFDHELKISNYLHNQIKTVKDIVIYGEENIDSPIITFNVEGQHPHDISTIIDNYGVAIRAGQHCCGPLMDLLGINASARASIAMYTNQKDIDNFIDALERSISLFK